MTFRLHDRAPLAWCVLAAALFGASTPAAKVLLDSLGPLTLAGLLYLGAALGVAPFARGLAARGSSVRGSLRQQPWRDAANVRRLAGAVLFGGIVGPVAFLLGLRLAAAGSVALWLNAEALFTVVLGWAFFREHVGSRTLVAAALVIGGGLLLAAPGGSTSAGAAALVAIACACWALDNHLTALVGGFTPAQTTLVKGLVAGGFNLALGWMVESPPSGGARISLALAVGALGYGLSIALYIAGAQQLGAIRSQLVFSTSPFLGLALAWLWLGEALTPWTIAAGILMAAGVGLLLSTSHYHAHAHEPVEHVHPHRHDDGHHDHVHPGLPAWTWHAHPHAHESLAHAHPHHPDLHHRHAHVTPPVA